MKITDISIDHCGVWHNLNLPLSDPGMSVFYGPNEAGKSTLMRFVRGMLYDFNGSGPGDPGGQSELKNVAGSLTLSTESGSYRIERRYTHGVENAVTITGPNGDRVDRDEFVELLGGVDQEVFHRVFAVGLRELQKLASLHEDQVAEKIYGLTLGPQSQRILHALEDIDQKSRKLIGANPQHGRLPELFGERDRLKAELDALAGHKERYRELSDSQQKLQSEIDDINARQEGIESQLRGHLYMQRAYAPWNRVRALDSELSQLPVVDSFPENGIERLDEIELQLAEAAQQRDRLKKEAKQNLEQAATFGGNKDIAKYEVTLQGLVDQRDWIAELEQQISHAQSKYDDLEKQVLERQPQWGEGHIADPAAEFDTSPNAYARLVSTARAFKRVVARREKTKRKAKRFNKLCQSQQEKLAAGLSRYRVDSAQDALVVVRERLTSMETLGELKLNERELHKRQLSFDELREHTEIRLALPASYYICTWSVTACGVLSILVGAFQGVMNQITIGAVFALIGLMLVMLSRLAKHHFEQGVDHRLEEISLAADQNFEELRNVREEILEVLGDSPGKADDGNWLPEAEEMRSCAREIADLERLAVSERKLERNRQRLENTNNAIYESQRNVAGARQSWQQLLSQLGLPETLDVGEAFTIWQSLVELSHARQEFRIAKIELKSRRQMYTSFCRRIAAVGRRMHEWEHNFDQPLVVLDHWEEQLKALHGGRDERRRLRREARDLARNAAEFRAAVEDYKTQRAALLREAGAADRDDFELRSQALTRRLLLERQLQQANEDLQTAGESENELAVTEEDLELFDAAHNTECIDLLKMEQEDLRNDLQEAYTNQGSLRRELEVIEVDQKSRHLRREIAQVQQRIHTAGGEWFALQRAKLAVEQMRHHVERTRQPVTIADASRYLTRITCGKYRNIWTPLGKRSLRIDDEHGHSLSVESLSSGTREQLFLAIRMALIHDYARHGVTLPMVLDDVLVNFDENRSEAALEALSDFSRQGHQVLMFTCHRHLAHMAKSKGCEPIWLPSRTDTAEAA